MKKVLISCGESSGDLYAGALAAEIARLAPGTKVMGLGGERLAAAGAELIGEYRRLTVTGLSEVVAGLPRSWAMLRRLQSVARAELPDVFVAIDFPDFNLRLAAGIKKLGIPVVYYVSPQLWAWRAYRLRTIRRIVDQMLVIFPFEEDLYRKAGVPVEFVGHPLIELTQVDQARAPFLSSLGLIPASITIALLPGSRPNEVRAHLPDMCTAVTQLADQVPGLQVVVARAPHLDSALFDPLKAVPAAKLRPAVVQGRTDTVLAASDVVITASGTATIQTAIHERPMVIVYRLSPLTYKIGKPFVKVDTYGMVNLVAGRRVVPELIQDNFTPAAVAEETLKFLVDASYERVARAGLREVKARLGEPGASRRAAESVLRVAGVPVSQAGLGA